MTDQPTPYQATAHTYRQAGWAGVLPLPARAKKPVPEGYTGATGIDPSAADIQSWIDDGIRTPRQGGIGYGYRPAGNIALRLPDGIIGIDVDNYGLKQGDTTLAQLSATCGPPPATWRTTSRDDGISGIYLYRVPTGLAWPGVAGPGIEIIQRRHRYAVVAPSIHPDTSRPYQWLRGADQSAVPPRPEALPELPAAWIEHLTRGLMAEDHARADLDNQAADDWMRDRVRTDQACRAAQAVLIDQLDHLRSGASRHDAAVQATAALAHLAGEGHQIAGAAIAYRHAWEAALAADGAARTADLTGEWRRLMVGAVRIAAAAHPNTSDVDPCDDPFAGLIDPSGPSLVGQLDEHLQAQLDKRAARTTLEDYCPEPAPAAVDPRHFPAGHPLGPMAGSTRGPDTAALPDPPWAVSGPPSATIEPPDGPVGAGPMTHTRQPAPTGHDRDPNTDRNAAGPQDGDTSLAGQAPPSDLQVQRNAAARHAYERELANRYARRQLDDEEAAATFRQPVYTRDLTAELALPDEDTVWRVEHVMPADANITLAAPFKAGKTTLVNHLTAALVDGIAFLDTHKVHRHPTGRVAVWNLEVGRGMYRRWIRDAGIEHPDRVTILPLRGYRMPLQTRRVEDWAVNWLTEHNITTWILDPFAAAYKGLSENDNAEVGRFLDAIDVIKQRAGVGELIMPVHTGRGQADEGQERARGATRLDDWADVRWILTRDEKDGETTRYFRAIGRDVDVPEARLGYDEELRRPYVTGPSRYAERRDAYDYDVLQIVGRNPGASSRAIRAGVREARGTASNATTDKAVARLIELGRIRVEQITEGRPETRHYLDDGLSKLLTPDTPEIDSMSTSGRADPDLFTVPTTVP